MGRVSEDHCARVVRALKHGRLVFFLGAGANLCNRPADTAWDPASQEYLPNGNELARYLAQEFGYPKHPKPATTGGETPAPACEETSGEERDEKQSYEPPDLARISQYAVVKTGVQLLHDELHLLFDGDFPSTDLHDFLASLPELQRRAGYPRTTDPNRRRLVLVTTNYDDLLERAFHARGEKFHVITYKASDEDAGADDEADDEDAGDRHARFQHWPANGWPPSGGPVLITRPNEYRGLLEPEPLPVILKIHGAIHRPSAEEDSFVITEDDYIEYLARTNIEKLLPAQLIVKLKHSHFLFLGYSLRDWNLRVFLHRLWGNRPENWKKSKSWAIQLGPDAVEREFWEYRDVTIHDLRLDEYVAALRRHMEQLDGPGAGA